MIAPLLLSAALAAPVQDFGQYHALVIGNDAYQHHPALQTAVPDARVLEQVLRDLYGFKVTSLFDATSAEIRNALHELRELPESSNVLIYFAGHGSLDQLSQQGYWFGVDATHYPSSRVSNADVRDEVRAMRARNVLVVADSCFSGSLTTRLPAGDNPCSTNYRYGRPASCSSLYPTRP